MNARSAGLPLLQRKSVKLRSVVLQLKIAMSRNTRGELRLDPIDITLLSLLQQDARRSTGNLAKAVGLSRSAVWERVKRLERCALILGYQAIIAPSAFGTAIDAIRHLSGASTAFRRFETDLRSADLFMSAAYR